MGRLSWSTPLSTRSLVLLDDWHVGPVIQLAGPVRIPGGARRRDDQLWRCAGVDTAARSSADAFGWQKGETTMISEGTRLKPTGAIEQSSARFQKAHRASNRLKSAH